uniref:Uncharacterized protein n=1 Tax=Oryza brachyantha TaxID=4533 RepID=J3LP24_ORYBR
MMVAWAPVNSGEVGDGMASGEKVVEERAKLMTGLNERKGDGRGLGTSGGCVRVQRQDAVTDGNHGSNQAVKGVQEWGNQRAVNVSWKREGKN